MQITIEQVQAMAPDEASAGAGKKLIALKHWPELGINDGALWGRCQGSAVYQVKVDLANLGYHCSCPSRKFPCKHVLGLLMLFAESPSAVGEGTSPDWVEAWLSKRRSRAEQSAQTKAERPDKPVDAKAQQRRAEQREARVTDGIERLDLWLRDLVRGGLAGLEAKSFTFWEEQARRLIDAQAPGLASRVAGLASIPRSSRDWPMRLLSELGRLKLLIHAWGRIDQLDPPLQSDIRQMIGWNLSQEELREQGEAVADEWMIAGQQVEDEERIRVQRSWLVGRSSGRTGLVLQFSAGGQPFAESIVPGVQQSATVLFYPGASRLRAKFEERGGMVDAIEERIPGHSTIEAFLCANASSLARQPWLGGLGCVLHDVTLVPREEEWLVRDSVGQALPLTRRPQWKMLAVTGGLPFDLVAEWNGRWLAPLGYSVAGQHRGA